MKPEDRRRLKQHIEMIVEHKMPAHHNVTFCPNCECDRDTILYSEVRECTVCHETFEAVCGIKPSNSDVSMTQDVLINNKTPQSVENDNRTNKGDEMSTVYVLKAVEEGSIEPDFEGMSIEKINQYLREHGYDPEKVGLRGKILAEALTKNIIAREIIQRFLEYPHGCRFCDYGVLRKPNDPLKGHDEDCLYLAAHAYLDNETSTVVKRDLSDAEIEELGAQEAEKRGEK